MASAFESGTCVSVKEICERSPKLNFYINDYQRGYRWTENETLKLLEDLFSFFIESYKDKKSFYCLQPLIVAAGRKDKDNNELLEVLDGQQRLTTIFIIQKFLKNKSLYTINYETRKGSELFLKQLGPQISEESYNEYIDYFHMYKSFETIEKYGKWDTIQTFNDVNGIEESKTFEEFVKEGDRIKFIWYDVTEQVLNSDTNELDDSKIRYVFSRFNAGKIPLTDAELIKAIFLSRIKDQIIQKYNTETSSAFLNELVEIERYKISSKWDEIEATLNIPDFWCFMYGKEDEHYSTRIDFLFDTIIREKGEKRNPFDYYDDKLSEKEKNGKTSVERNWKEITDLFDIFRNWYNDRMLYHFIGFLRYCDRNYKNINVSVYNIIDIFNNSESHNEFITLLILLSKAYAIGDDNDIEDINKKMIDFGRSKKDDDKKNAFLNFKNTIKKYSREDDSQLEIIISDISYTSSNIRKVLLLINILTVVNLKTEMRISFANVYSQSYDLEHISSQTPKDLTDKDEIENWAIHMLEYITGKEYIASEKAKPKDKKDKKIPVKNFLNLINAYQPLDSNEKVIVDYLVSKIERPEPPIFTDNFTEEVLFKQLGINTKSKPFSGDGIQNMVLLDSNTNRGYGNAFFPVKRNKIYNQELKGIYILPCTKNVFNKAYSKKMNDLMEWTEDDAKLYLKVMVETWRSKLV